MLSINYRIKIIAFIIVLYSIYRLSFFKSENTIAVHSPPWLLSRIVHIDLKGLPPKLSYLKSVLKLIKLSGATGLLMEYEDMFPYTGILRNITANNHYLEAELHDFLSAAEKEGLLVIPLIQTFGHMEFVLKHDEFRDLREMNPDTRALCPSKQRSFTIIAEIINQIVKLHEKALGKLKYIHIGCDEVSMTNFCNDCLKRNLPTSVIYLSHLTEVVKYIKNIEVLIWDDMLRPLIAGEGNNIRKLAATNAHPVVWQYGTVNLQNFIWHNYMKLFKNVWIASAYKGADKKTSLIPNIEKRLDNSRSWMAFAEHFVKADSRNQYSFRGIILTGWSRYSHNSPICDPFPASLPSLIFNLNYVTLYSKAQMKSDHVLKRSILKTNRLLQCPKIKSDFRNESHYFEDCKFDGHDLYRILKSNKDTNELKRTLHKYFDERSSQELLIQMRQSVIKL